VYTWDGWYKGWLPSHTHAYTVCVCIHISYEIKSTWDNEGLIGGCEWQRAVACHVTLAGNHRYRRLCVCVCVCVCGTTARLLWAAGNGSWTWLAKTSTEYTHVCFYISTTYSLWSYVLSYNESYYVFAYTHKDKYVIHHPSFHIASYQYIIHTQKKNIDNKL
jgi:hypothetical protein